MQHSAARCMHQRLQHWLVNMSLMVLLFVQYMTCSLVMVVDMVVVVVMVVIGAVMLSA